MKYETYCKNLVRDFREFFIGREDAYGIYDDNGNVTVIKEKITDEIIQKHLDHNITIGSYYAYRDIWDSEWFCKWINVDIDDHSNSFEGNLLHLAFQVRNHLECVYQIDKHNICLENSGRGFHIWIKLFQSTLREAFNFREHIRLELKNEFNLEEEIFPKQAYIEDNGYGNWVKLPLSMNRKCKPWKYCQIIDGFKLSTQGSGHVPIGLPDIIPKKKEKREGIKLEPIKLEPNDQVKWEELLQVLPPCLRRIAIDCSLTHNTGNGIGEKMNMTLCNALIMLGVNDNLIHRAFSTHTNYSIGKTQYKANYLRGCYNPDYIIPFTCETMKERDFCIECGNRNHRIWKWSDE